MPHCINPSASAKCETTPLLSWRLGIICSLFCALSFGDNNILRKEVKVNALNPTKFHLEGECSAKIVQTMGRLEKQVKFKY